MNYDQWGGWGRGGVIYVPLNEELPCVGGNELDVDAVDHIIREEIAVLNEAAIVDSGDGGLRHRHLLAMVASTRAPPGIKPGFSNDEPSFAELEGPLLLCADDVVLLRRWRVGVVHVRGLGHRLEVVIVALFCQIRFYVNNVFIVDVTVVITGHWIREREVGYIACAGGASIGL